jgi:hypothetical protein
LLGNGSEWLSLLQFTAWVDAVIFVFSLENEASFNAIYNYYTKMAHFRNSAEIPLILVGTQGKATLPCSWDLKRSPTFRRTFCWDSQG